VIPSAGRESLTKLLQALEAAPGPAPERVIVVDDRRDRRPGLAREGIEVLHGAGRGPAAARNLGWRAASAEWVAFLDDDVLPPPHWRTALAEDLAGLAPEVAASQGRIVVPLPGDRRPTDWERNVAGLEHARWATADLAYRRSALEAAGGFDERFPLYFEENDFLRRVRGEIVYVPAARVRHHESAATAQAWTDRTERWVWSTYGWMLRRRGAALTRTVAAVNVAGALGRAAWMAPASALAPARFRGPSRTFANWARLHTIGLRPRRSLMRHR
jgi:GT2 family glycosyltransferase